MRNGTNDRKSWAEKRAWMARQPEPHEQGPCCTTLSYDKAAELGYDYHNPPPGFALSATHAGYVRRCAKHAGPTPYRAWIADIPLFRFKRWMQMRCAFPIEDLRSLLPPTHPGHTPL